MKIYEKRLTKNIFKRSVISLLTAFKNEWYEIYVVGGCVRDIVIGNTPHDIDLTTNAKPKETIRILEKEGLKYHKLGIKFGTVVAHVNGEDMEITTYRSESNTDGRHCNVNFVSSLEKDLKRRDFTINAMAYDVLTDELVDPFYGYNDIKNKILRTVGNPKERVDEDSLRVLRALRFSIKYNFKMELNLKEKIYEFIEKGKIDNLSKERISNELMKILSVENLTKDNFNMLTPLFFHLFPLLKLQENFDQNNRFHCFDLWTHTSKSILLVSQIVKNTFVNVDIAKCRLAMLLHDIGKPLCESKDKDGESHYYNHNEVGYNIVVPLLKGLKFTNKDVDFISTLVKYHDSNFIGDSEKSVKKLIKKVGEDKIESLLVIMLADKQSQNMSCATPYYLNLIRAMDTYQALKDKHELAAESSNLAVNGKDIIEVFNIEPSPLIGDLIRTASEAVDDGVIENTKEDILKYLSPIFKSKTHI